VLAHGYPDTYPYFSYGWAPSIVATGYDVAKDAAAVLEEIVRRVRSRYPELSIDSVLRPGSGGKVLIEASLNAALVVVGARGHGGFGGLSIGSVAAQTAAHAASPVMVIRPTNHSGDEKADVTEPDIAVPHPGPVIVGLDGAPDQDATLEYAFRAAAARGVPLVAVNVWWQLPKHNLGPDVPGHYNLAKAQDEARRLLAEMTAGWSSQFPEVPLEQRSMQSMNPSYTLIQSSQTAGLVVVGSRGRGGFAGLLLGSVGRDLIGHAHSPVVVVHPARTERP
jgi:nucleotide-binding universal stress UspA family protein